MAPAGSKSKVSFLSRLRLVPGGVQAHAPGFAVVSGCSGMSLIGTVTGSWRRFAPGLSFRRALRPLATRLWVIGVAGWHAWHGTLPHAFTMGGVGVAALLANAASFGLLSAYRAGDANMRSAWICTRRAR